MLRALTSGLFHFSGQADGLALSQHVQARLVQRDHFELVLGLFRQQPQADQLAADRLPLGLGMFPANAVGAQLMVPVLADIFGLRAQEHVHSMIEAEVEAAVPADAVHARKQLLRFQRAVVGGALLQAVVAAGAIVFTIGFAKIAQ